jgi:hypothetical protein
MQYLTRPMYRDGGPAGSDVQGSGRAFDLPLAHELPNHTGLYAQGLHDLRDLGTDIVQ